MLVGIDALGCGEVAGALVQQSKGVGQRARHQPDLVDLLAQTDKFRLPGEAGIELWQSGRDIVGSAVLAAAFEVDAGIDDRRTDAFDGTGEGFGPKRLLGREEAQCCALAARKAPESRPGKGEAEFLAWAILVNEQQVAFFALAKIPGKPAFLIAEIGIPERARRELDGFCQCRPRSNHTGQCGQRTEQRTTHNKNLRQSC